LSRSSDAKGRHLQIHIVDEPDPKILGDLSYDEPATNYVNLYFVNGGLIISQFGDSQRDREALETFQKLCPGRTVRPVRVAALPLAGGVIHYATQTALSADEE
jgi:agmatine/peptidylarginine deiminase